MNKADKFFAAFSFIFVLVCLAGLIIFHGFGAFVLGLMVGFNVFNTMDSMTR